MTTNDPPHGLESSGQTSPSADTHGKWREWTKVVGTNWPKWLKETIKLAPVLAVLVAVWVAVQGQVTVDRSNRATLTQSEDAQLSTAITAIGSNDMAEQIAGLLLLARNTSSRFTMMGQTEETPSDVYGDYTTALQILSGYLSSHGEMLLDSSTQTAASFGRGYGLPPPPGIPLNIIYAANQVEFLLAPNMESSVAALNVGMQPSIDLSNDELIGQPWTGINFSWISAYMVGIDLRGASLESSRWGKDSDLSGSDLQCADLLDADFQGANLSNADLEGAYVQGADFRGANLTGVVFKQLYGKPKWAPPGTTTHSARRWRQAACLVNKSIWRGQPTQLSAPATPASPGPRPSPTPKPSASRKNT